MKCVDYLLSTARASVDIVNGDGDTALIVGVQYNSFECMKYLISFGADLNIVNNKRNTVLLEAIKRDKDLFVECLIANKADASIADSDGQTIYELLDTNNPEHEH